MAKDRILIVEDDQSLILYYKGILAALDVKVDTASSYDEALKQLKTFDYILHVIDVSLDGDEPGTNLIGRAGAGPESCLVLSASMTEEMVREIMEVHGVPREQIITKPVSSDSLVDLVNSKIAAKDEHNGNHNNHTSDEQPNETPQPEVRSKFYAEKVVLRYLIDYLADHKLRTLVFVIFLAVFVNFLVHYLKIDAFNEISNVIQTRNETMFRHFNKGDHVSGTTYVEISGYEIVREFSKIPEDVVLPPSTKELLEYVDDRKEQLSKIKLLIYPNDNYLLVVINKDETFRHYWISDRKYLEGLGIGQDLTFKQIVIKAWAASFKNF